LTQPEIFSLSKNRECAQPSGCSDGHSSSHLVNSCVTWPIVAVNRVSCTTLTGLSSAQYLRSGEKVPRTWGELSQRAAEVLWAGRPLVAFSGWRERRCFDRGWPSKQSKIWLSRMAIERQLISAITVDTFHSESRIGYQNWRYSRSLIETFALNFWILNLWISSRCSRIIRWTREEPIAMRTLILESDRTFDYSQKEKHNLQCKIRSRISLRRWQIVAILNWWM
jgi:hypothetical protein